MCSPSFKCLKTFFLIIYKCKWIFIPTMAYWNKYKWSIVEIKEQRAAFAVNQHSNSKKKKKTSQLIYLHENTEELTLKESHGEEKLLSRCWQARRAAEVDFRASSGKTKEWWKLSEEPQQQQQQLGFCCLPAGWSLHRRRLLLPVKPNTSAGPDGNKQWFDKHLKERKTLMKKKTKKKTLKLYKQ